MDNYKIVSVIGGKGFIGQYLVNSLLNDGFYVKIISRNAKYSKPKFTLSKLGQLSYLNCDVKDLKTLKSFIKGSSIVINLTGLLSETRNNNFKIVHDLGTKNIVEASNEGGVKKILHISAIGASKTSLSNYAQTKYLGEQNIKKFKSFCIIRPSIVYGDEDKGARAGDQVPEGENGGNDLQERQGGAAQHANERPGAGQGAG